MTMYQTKIKRIVDIAVAGSGLIALSLPMAALTICLHRSNHGAGAFFVQERPGLGGKPFKIYKFKTMTDERDDQGNLLSDEQRLTPFGKFIRSTSLDELPQLWNVLRGDMSLVGPRPLLMEYLPLYSDEQKRRHNVRPGITGLAQIRGRNSISWQQKFEYDIQYIDNVSAQTDINILLDTISHVIQRRGINAEHHATMPDFDGTN